MARSLCMILLCRCLLSCSDSSNLPMTQQPIDPIRVHLTIIDSEIDSRHPLLRDRELESVDLQPGRFRSTSRQLAGPSISHGTEVALAAIRGQERILSDVDVAMVSLVIADEEGVDADATISDRSNYGKSVDIAAPGTFGDCRRVFLSNEPAYGQGVSLLYSSMRPDVRTAKSTCDLMNLPSREPTGTTSAAAGYVSGLASALWSRSLHLGAKEVALMLCADATNAPTAGVRCGSLQYSAAEPGLR